MAPSFLVVRRCFGRLCASLTSSEKTQFSSLQYYRRADMGTACSRALDKQPDHSSTDVSASTDAFDQAKATEKPQTDVPIVVDATDQIKIDQRASARARRLSVVSPPNEEQEISRLDLVDDDRILSMQSSPQAYPPCPQEMPTKKNTTRQRRLSVVATNVGPSSLSSEGVAEQDEDVQTHEESASPMPVHQPKDVRGVSRCSSSRSRLDVECLSRTGREPGYKKTNQDNCFAFEKFVRRGHSLYAAFDGHGPNGHVVSSFVKHQLPLMLTRKLRRSTTREVATDDIVEALKDVFLHVHESVCQPPIDAEFSGTTATVGLVIGTKLFVAWVGDSRCVVGLQTDNGIVAKDVTRDHKPDHSVERARIVASGGRVKRLTNESGNEIGPSRVWLKYAWIPGLAMSRALGDVCAHQVGVISEPEVSVTDLTADVAFLVIASDGVWEFVSSQEAVDIIAAAPDAATACRKLVDESYHRWLVEENGVVDDITAVIVKFDNTSSVATDEIAQD